MLIRNEPQKQKWAKELEEVLSKCQGGTSGAKITNNEPKAAIKQQQQQPNVPKQKSTPIVKARRKNL